IQVRRNGRARLNPSPWNRERPRIRPYCCSEERRAGVFETCGAASSDPRGRESAGRCRSSKQRNPGRRKATVMSKPGIRVNLSIPQHKELSVGTLRALIRNAGLSVDEFIDLL